MTAPQFDFHPDMAELLAAKDALPTGRSQRDVAGRLERLCGQHAAALPGRHGRGRHAAGLLGSRHQRADHGPVLPAGRAGLAVGLRGVPAWRRLHQRQP